MSEGSCQTKSSCSVDHSGGAHEFQDELIKQSLNLIRHKLLVMSGKGGVGKSSIAANIAIGLSQKGYKVGLLDVDLHGPDIPRLLGLGGLLRLKENKMIEPMEFSPNLKVISIELLSPDKDTSIIWRGPLKISVIRQFISDVSWGELDYLVIDSPPGTGDEPLTVAQTVTGAKAVIVTTPQDISLADVRKSIDFCKHVNMPILGLVENMSGFVCPNCGEKIDLFKKGGGEKTAIESSIPFLGRIPVDPYMVISGDSGRPILLEDNDSPATSALKAVVDKIIERTEGKASDKMDQSSEIENSMPTVKQDVKEDKMRIAIPLANGVLCNHFGHCQEFALIDVENGKIVSQKKATPPPHEPGVIPRWINEQGVNVIIAGGMGARAQQFFQEFGIQVITGAPSLDPETIVNQYLRDELVTGPNVCDH